MLVYQKRIYREDLRNNPRVKYLFGDNLLRVGLGGQAKEMRGEPNAIGVPTKKQPWNDDYSFFNDDEYDENIQHMIEALSPVRFAWDEVSSLIVVVPADGLGTGLSQMPERCPKTFSWLKGLGLGGVA